VAQAAFNLMQSRPSLLGEEGRSHTHLRLQS
jgi:hypothetical protein